MCLHVRHAMSFALCVRSPFCIRTESARDREDDARAQEIPLSHVFQVSLGSPRATDDTCSDTSSRLCWYVGEKYLRDLKAKEEFSSRVLESLEALSGYLMSEVHVMERGSDAAKRDAKDQVPNDRVKDPAALARELRWRIRLAAGTTSDDEELGRPAKKSMVNGNGIKRKRASVEPRGGPVLFRNFEPKEWDWMQDLPREEDERTVMASCPCVGEEEEEEGEGEEGWHQRWSSNWDDEALLAEDANERATVRRKRDVVLKLRKADGGVERQRVERVFERWVWDRTSIGVVDAVMEVEPSNQMDVDDQPKEEDGTT